MHVKNTKTSDRGSRPGYASRTCNSQTPLYLMLLLYDSDTGICVVTGLGNCIAPIFLSEIAPFNYRGAFGTLHQLFVTLGILLASIFGIPQLLGL